MNDWYDNVTGRTGCGPGWDKIVFPLIERCKAEGIEIHQIKEKFGGLRFYVGPAPDSFYDAVDAAEEQSFKTCETCGAPGRPRGGGWIKTLCDTHAEERKWSEQST